MIREITVYVNNLGEVADLNEIGTIRVYSKDGNQWSVVREVPFRFYRKEEKKDISLDAVSIIETFGNCKIFVAKEFSEEAYKILDSMGVSVWKMDGNPSNFLEYILEKEYEEAQEIKLIETFNDDKKKHAINPIKLNENGHYILNLKELQDYNVGVTSKQVLKPFLNNEEFNELIVTCSHIPNWLEEELKKLNLKFNCTKAGQNDYIMIINKSSI
ncbi:Fe-only nitrogenase accessory protein AnfO [Clostridium chromiireducens]|uniref:Fe-only nitrogenase accessory protein AnfO n=1 Tax=Clostridium chromiireducens TaxID=225345 RepID=A0A964RT88_9CLOT|nr:Fe-only nitrogenase accessory protein AnfO [Clostridium chromiireducens]MVX67382.1 Fe-only nitrogenase accessory protein AnfO [Clostridium chromiireducens]